MQENRDRQSNISYYAGIFLIGFTTLTIEVTFSRLLSVITHYHLAFFAVSTAMLGPWKLQKYETRLAMGAQFKDTETLEPLKSSSAPISE